MPYYYWDLYRFLLTFTNHVKLLLSRFISKGRNRESRLWNSAAAAWRVVRGWREGGDGRRRGWYDVERAKSSGRRRKHASLAGTHVETSSAAGLAGALSGVCFGCAQRIGERRRGTRAENDWQSVVSTRGRVRADAAALSRPKARPPKPRGAYFTNDRPPHSTPLSQRTRITCTRWHTRACFRPLSRGMREKKRPLREGGLS